MTWGELKAWAAKNGITDGHEVIVEATCEPNPNESIRLSNAGVCDCRERPGMRVPYEPPAIVIVGFSRKATLMTTDKGSLWCV